jgi:hypothetical protein
MLARILPARAFSNKRTLAQLKKSADHVTRPAKRAKALAPLFDELAGKSSREIARILNDRNVATPTGKPWSAMTVIRARDRLAASA